MVLDMPNNPGEPTVSPEALAHKRKSVEQNAVCAVGLHYGATPGNIDTFRQVAPEVFALKLYLDHTTGDLKIDELETIREIMRAWPAEQPLCVHAEDRRWQLCLVCCLR